MQFSTVLSPNSHDDEVVPSSQPIAQSPDDSEEVPSSLPPVLPSYTDDQEGEQPEDKDLSSSSEEEEYATADAYSSDEDDVPLASIKKNNQATRKMSSQKAKKTNTDTVRLNVTQSAFQNHADVL